MGCVESRSENGSSMNIFHVVNINERGQRQRSARLEVTDTHLVLHQRGRTPICWPLRCLRRYGFDAEQFSFESGRRSPSGPGVYTFKCRRAEHLFNLLQYRIQSIAEDPSSRDIWPIPSSLTALREARNNSQVIGRRNNSIEDSHGYLSPLSSRFDSFRIPTVSNPPVLPTSGANGGIAGITNFSSSVTPAGDLRSPGQNQTQIHPAAGMYTNDMAASRDMSQRRLEEREEPIAMSNREAFKRDSTARVPCVDHISALSASDRPSSYSSSGSERPSSTLNHIDRGGLLPLQPNAVQLRHFNGFAEVPRSFHNSETPISLSYENIETCRDYSRLDELRKFKDHPVYMNVDLDIGRGENDHVYMNLSTEKEVALPSIHPRTTRMMGSAGSGSSQSGTTTTTDTDQAHQINYIQVDIERGSDSSQTAPLSPQGSVGSVIQDYPRSVPSTYATIDIDKTEALRETAQATVTGEARGNGSSRRTRHETNFNPIGVTRHCSLIPD